MTDAGARTREPARATRLAGFELVHEPLSLLRDGVEVPLGGRALQLLAVLADHPGEFVPKATLLTTVWPDVAVSDASLYAALRDARRAVGDDGRRQTVIETRKGRGYRLVPSETVAATESLDDAALVRRTINAVGAADPALVRRIQARTAGDPALVDALLEDLALEGLSGPALALSAESIPLRAAIVDAQMTALPALNDDLIRDLRPLALFAEPFARASPGLETASDAISRGLEAGWITPVPERPHRYRLRLPAAREWLRRSFGTREEEQAHADLGLAWSRADAVADEGSRRAAVARHFRLAGGAVPTGDAVAASRAAAEASADLHERRLHLAAAYSRADDESDIIRISLASEMGEACFRAGDHDAGRAAYREAADLALANGAHEAFARAALGFAGHAANTETAATAPERIALLDEALAQTPHLDDVLAGRLEARLALELRWTTRADESRPRIARALEAVGATSSATDADRAAVLHDAYWATLSPDEPDERLRLAEAFVLAAEHSGDPVHRVLAHSVLGATRLEAGDRAGAEAAYRAGTETTPPETHAGLPIWEASTLACFATLDANWEEAERWMVRARDLSRASGSRNGDLIFAAQLAWLRFDQERWDEFAGLATAALASPLAVTRAGAALILACSGRETEARAQLDVLMDRLTELPRDAFWLATLSTLAELSSRLGAADAAASLAASLSPYTDRCVLIGMRTVCRGAAAHALGVALATAGDAVAACHALEAAVRMNARIAAPALVARSQRALAEALERTAADPPRVRALREEADRTRRQIGLSD